MGPLSALILTANAISGQITSFRLVMTEPWTLSEVITRKSGCEWGQKKKKETREWRGGGRGQKRERREGDEIGWQSILIWNQKTGRGQIDILVHMHVCEYLLNWQWCQTSRRVNVTHIEEEGGRGPLFFFLCLSLCTYKFSLSLSARSLQTGSIHFRTTKNHSGREVRGNCSILWQGRRQMCDRGKSYRRWQPFTLVWDGWMDGVGERGSCLWVGRCQKRKRCPVKS